MSASFAFGLAVLIGIPLGATLAIAQNIREIPSRFEMRRAEWVLRACLPFLPARCYPQLLVLGHKARMLGTESVHFHRVTALKVRMFFLKQSAAFFRRGVHPLGSAQPLLPPSGAENDPRASHGCDSAKERN